MLGAFGILFLSATVFSGNSGEKMEYAPASRPTTVTIMDQMAKVRDEESGPKIDLSPVPINQRGDFIKVDLEKQKKEKEERIAEAKLRRLENKRLRKRL